MNSIPAKKSLGQNFLKDEHVLQTIANVIEPNENDIILEIGPGKGALTKYLIQKKSQYLAYEIDERMQSILTKLTDHIVWKDFLTCNLQQDLENIVYDQIYVVANIPYYITTPIINKVISETSVDEMIVMVQKEVADHEKNYRNGAWLYRFADRDYAGRGRL